MANEDDLNRAWDGDKNLQNADLSHADLREIDLSGVILQGATLGGANLVKAKLVGANLEVVNLEGASLDGANLEGTNLDGADMQNARLDSVNLEGASLETVDLQGAILQGAKLMRASLYGANLEGANLEGADLRGANLEGADLRGANLQNTDLRGVNGLICKNLRLGRNWQYSFRDKELACGASLPPPPHDTTREIQENDLLWTFFGDLKGLREDEKYLYIVNKEGIERKISTEKYAASYIKNLKAKINTLTGNPVDFQTATNWSEETWFNDIRKSEYSTPETPSQPNETDNVASHLTTLIQQRELTHWTAQSLADALAEFTKHQDNQLDQADKEFLISLQKSLQEIAIATKKEADDKDAQITALQKEIDEFKEQIEVLKNQPDNEKTSFLKEYILNAGESLGKATGPAFLISLTFGLSYLSGTPPNDIAEWLKLLK